MDYVCVETNVFVIKFYSLYLVYYVKNIVYLQYKIIILLIYYIKHIKIFNKKIKYFINKSKFFESIWSISNCTMIVVEEIKMIVIILFHLNFALNVFDVTKYSILFEKIDQITETSQMSQTKIIGEQIRLNNTISVGMQIMQVLIIAV